MARTFIVTEPVVDLRSHPEMSFPNDFSHQDGRETQLLFGEKLRLIEENGEWLKVAALEQTLYSAENGWHAYPGWVNRSEVLEGLLAPATHVVCKPGSFSYGTCINLLYQGGETVRPIPQTPLRDQLIKEASLFLDAPYLWGGRASLLKNQIASVDCSGLINLLYRAQGIQIPRNAHDQYLVSQPTSKLLPGDPLYLAKEKRITHVILKLDDSTFIEAPETGKKVRLLKWGTHLWEEEGKIHFFDRDKSYFPFPRRFIPL